MPNTPRPLRKNASGDHGPAVGEPGASEDGHPPDNLPAMVVATAAPAFAVRHRESGAVFACTDGTTSELVAASDKQALVKQVYLCTKASDRV
jgi:hypothetical protein